MSDGLANLSMTHSDLALDIVNIICSIRNELVSVGVFKLVGCRPSCYFCMPQDFNKKVWISGFFSCTYSALCLVGAGHDHGLYRPASGAAHGP